MTYDNLVPPFTRLKESHLPGAVALSSSMGWPYRLEDWAFALTLGEGIALVQDGKLIGTAMRWHYGDNFTSVGMIIVDKNFQGRGFGAAIVDLLLSGIESRTVFLNATEEAVKLYKNRGFVGAGTLNQHQGVPTIEHNNSQWNQVRKADAGDLSLIMALDQESLGMERKDLIASLAKQGQLTLIINEGIVTGYAACREFGRGHVIGPVVAQTLEDARALIGEAMSRLADCFVRVDTSADSGLSPWLTSCGLPCVDTATPMTRGTPPQVSPRILTFALSNQSLG